MRARPNQPSLARPTERLYTAQVQLLQTRRSLLLQDLDALTVSSRANGRVSIVVPVGSPVGIGTSVASVTPERADEIVAYVPAETEPRLIEPGVAVRLAGPRTLSCTEPGRVLRRGAGVEQAPAQMRGFLNSEVFGLPVYISIPDGCELGVGQLLTVEFPKART